jgi:hypothetical protein
MTYGERQKLSKNERRGEKNAQNTFSGIQLAIKALPVVTL